MIMYHLTDHEFEIGDTILPQPYGYAHLDESVALETILERYRPPNKLKRKESVFLLKKPPEGKDFGAVGSIFLIKVEVGEDVMQNSSDMSWFASLDQGFEDVQWLEDDYKPNELREIASRYWSGILSDNPSVEYRAKSARVVEVTKK
jgi:hypothetical protein